MDLGQLLNRPDELPAKRVALAELNVNKPAKRLKHNVLSKVEGILPTSQPSNLPEQTSTPQRPTHRNLAPSLSLPPISHLTSSIDHSRVSNDAPILRPLSPVAPTTPTRTHGGMVTPATGRSQAANNKNSSSFYAVHNSRKKNEMFFNITSADDFQHRTRASVTDIGSDRSMDHSMERSFQDPSSAIKRNRRKILWSHEASVVAAHEFKRLYDFKISSSFLKKEYQDIAEVLNSRFGRGLFSETSVRNRKGFFQCLSHIYTSLRDHRLYHDRFNDQYVPLLTEEEWKDAGQYFEPSYLRKFRGKTDNEDLHIVCSIFKKRPMRRNDDMTYIQPFREDELKVIGKIVILVQKGMLTLEEVTAVFVQSEEVAWIGLLYPHLEARDEDFLKIVRDNFDLSKTGGGKGEVDLQRFWKMMSMTQGQ